MSDAEKHKYTMGNAEKGGVPARIGKEDGVQDDVSLSEAGSHTCVPPPCPPSRSPCPSSFLKRGRSTENVPFFPLSHRLMIDRTLTAFPHASVYPTPDKRLGAVSTAISSRRVRSDLHLLPSEIKTV